MAIIELPPQIRLVCDECGEDAGESEYGGYMVFDASDPDDALRIAAFERLPDNRIVCDNCAYELARESNAKASE